ncbi:unnamed protein product [Cuscuta campestris]|uniref:PWWP domain-containing protein n=2 Tax=Cuscuta sect. Cleistogrammica TaxID=1824901 RepID=A0A484L0P9_9ASTE|nr:hypothetical protein DM860_015035 [Cuscuta australis]VFQ69786.1 unnamed protein product [Cuscuta campestris]
MGSSVGCCPKSIDPTAGGLVWVRRGNGSWWPGQILGQEELVESSTALPKAGTPVKLLGRDDTSVDWYNLETSKQVKAFRCGDYEKCIEKAKAVAANDSKKVVKHTRREDAILRALELETASLAKDEDMDNKIVNGSDGCSGSNPEFSECRGTSSASEEANTASPSEEQPVQVSQQHQTLPGESDDGSGGAPEGVKRMRGLDDLGTGVVQSLKRKRSQVAHVREFLKKKSRRRRRLMKVLESTAMVTVPVVCEEGLPSPNESDLAGASCSMEMVSTPELPKNGGLESLFDVPFVAEEKNSAGLPPSVSLPSQSAQNGAEETGTQISQVGTMLLGNGEQLVELGSSSLGNMEVNAVSEKIEKGTSKWQSKRKRNSRRQARNCDSEKTVGANHKSQFRSWGTNTSHMRGPPNAEVSNLQRSLPHRQSRFSVNPKYESPPPLFDVNLEVKSSHGRPQHLPYVSLTSKINGCCAITGHPITVEVLADGYCAQLLLRANASECGDENHHLEGQDYSSALQGGLKVSSCIKKLKSKKPTLLSSKKMRKLSSLNGSRKQIQEKKHSEVQEGPTLACVPLKKVFSRINEALISCSP